MNDTSRISMAHLVWPILIENLLRTALTSVDVFMLSFYSEKAVAAVGLAQQFAFFIMLTYNIVAVGTSILISQNLGAGKRDDAGLVAIGSLAMVVVFSVVMSLAMVFAAEPILASYKLEPEVHTFAWQFMVIYGAGSLFVAVNIIQGTVLRSHGHSRDPMFVNIAANILNVLGNLLFIFGPQIGPVKFPVLGVAGVAMSTVFSQFVACFAMQWCIRRRKDVDIPYRRVFSVPGKFYKQILTVGIPSAGENLSFNIGQILIMRFVSVLGTAAMSAYVYAFTVLRYVFMPSFSIGIATQIKVGHLVGAGDQDGAYKRVLRYFGVAILLSTSLIILANLFKPVIFSIFTHDSEVLSLVTFAMLVSLFLEPGRCFNLVIISGLKGAGDVRFPVYMGMIFMWGVGVAMGYVLGIALGWGLLGIWIAMASDEWIRGLIMLFRWRSGAWRNRAFVKKDPATQVEAS